jgi:hypothetical protein
MGGGQPPIGVYLGEVGEGQRLHSAPLLDGTAAMCSLISSRRTMSRLAHCAWTLRDAKVTAGDAAATAIASVAI